MISKALATEFKELPALEVIEPGDVDGFEEESEGREPFPIDALPYPYREMAEAAAQSVMVPVVITAACALMIVSAALGKKLQVRTKPNRLTPAMLYLLLFAKSGSGKSEASRLMNRPMTDLHLELEKQWREKDHPAILCELDDIDQELQRIRKDQRESPGNEARNEAKLELFQRKAELEARAQPTLCIGDLTIEAFAVGLQENDEQLTLLSIDAAKAVQNLLGRYSADGEPDDALHRMAFSMDFHTEKRLSRGPITLQAPAATLLWFCQPYLIRKVFNNEVLRHGGFIARCLTVDTKAEVLDEPEEDPEIPLKVEQTYYDHVRALFKAFRLRKGDPTIIERTPEVKTIMRQHFNSIAARRRTGDLQDVNEFATRWTEQAWRIALGLHAMRHGTISGQHAMDEKSALDGIRIQEWFQREELRLLASGRDEAAGQDAERLAEAICRKSISQNGGAPKVSLRDLERLGWEKEAVLRAIECSGGKLSIETPPRNGPGRPASFVTFKGEPRPLYRGKRS